MFNYFANLTASCGLLTWLGILITYIQWHKGTRAQGFDRKSLPFVAPLQPCTPARSLTAADAFRPHLLCSDSDRAFEPASAGRLRASSDARQQVVILLFQGFEVFMDAGKLENGDFDACVSCTATFADGAGLPSSPPVLALMRGPVLTRPDLPLPLFAILCVLPNLQIELTSQLLVCRASMPARLTSTVATSSSSRRRSSARSRWTSCD